jgi:hypothetical protein
VAVWPNAVSGLSRYNATVAGAGAASRNPALAPGYAAGWTALRFTGVDDLTAADVGAALLVPLDLTQSRATGFSIFLVATAAATAQSTYFTSVLSSPSCPFSLGFAGALMDVLRDCDGNLWGSGTAIPAGGSPLRMYEYITFPSGSAALFINSAIADTGSAQTFPTSLRLGGTLDSVVAELIIFATALPSDQRQQIEAYLSRRYLLPLPMDHPYNITGSRSSGETGSATIISAPDAIQGLQSWLLPNWLPIGSMLPLWPNSAPSAAFSAYADEAQTVTLPPPPSPSPFCIAGASRPGRYVS